MEGPIGLGCSPDSCSTDDSDIISVLVFLSRIALVCGADVELSPATLGSISVKILCNIAVPICDSGLGILFRCESHNVIKPAGYLELFFQTKCQSHVHLVP